MSASDFFVATVDQRLPIFSDEIVTANILLQKLKENGCMKMGQGGDGFSLRVRKSRGAIVRAVGDWTPETAKTMENMQRIEGQYRAYAGTIMMSKNQLKRNEYADQTAKVLEFMEEQLNGFLQDFEDVIGTDLHADGVAAGSDEATPMEGLDSIVDTDNTHFGIDRTSSANSWWRANRETIPNNFLDDDDADGVVNGLYSMRKAYMLACVGGDPGNEKSVQKSLTAIRKNKPDLIIGTRLSFINYCTALQPQQHYIGGTNDMGQKVAFFGSEFEWDPYATADKIRILTTKTFRYLVVGDQLIYRDDGDLPATGQPRAKVWTLSSQGQLLNSQPRLCSEVANAD